MVVNWQAVVKAIFFAAVIILSGCDGTNFDFLSSDRLNKWLVSNQKKIDFLVSNIHDENFVGVLNSCEKETYDISSSIIVGLLSEIEKINPNECLTVVVAREKQLSKNKLISISFPVIREGGCIPSGDCRITTIIYYPNEKLGGFYDPIEQEEYSYTSLTVDGWYMLER